MMTPAANPASLTWLDLGLLNDVLFQFENAAGTWVQGLVPVALATFYSLATLEIAWTGLRTAIRSGGDGLGSFFETLLRKVVLLGFVLWLITVSPGLLPRVIASFQSAGAIASGTDRLHPSSFLATGVSIADAYVKQVNTMGLLLDPFGVMMTASGALVTVFLFATMAAIMVVALIESLIAIAAMPFLLAMAGSRWTARIAEGALAYVVRTGIKLFVLHLVAGVVDVVTVQWAARINSEFIGPVSYLGFVGSAWALTFVVWSIPRYAANIVPPGLSFGLTPAIGDN